jgi:hypothetical protein
MFLSVIFFKERGHYIFCRTVISVSLQTVWITLPIRCKMSVVYMLHSDIYLFYFSEWEKSVILSYVIKLADAYWY